MNKAYTRINFQNAPSTATPLNATNLNKMDKAINDLDDRIIELSGYQEEAQEAAEQASSSASAAAKAAETATADAEARVNEIIAGMEVYTKEESDKKFASVIKQVATGSPILIKDSSDAGVIDFKGKGRSTQQIKMIQGYYDSQTGVYSSNTNAVCNEKSIPCKTGDNIEITVDTTSTIIGIFYNGSSFVSSSKSENTTKATFTIPSNANYYNFDIIKDSSISPSTVGAITITVNGSVGYPSPDYPQPIKSVADSGYFDGELSQGYYHRLTNGNFVSASGIICNKNPIPCNENGIIKVAYETATKIQILCYGESGLLTSTSEENVKESTLTAPSGTKYFNYNIEEANITPANAKPITVTINGKYALIVKSKGKNLLNINEIDKDTTFFSYTKYTNEIVKATAVKTSVGEFICSFSAYLEKGKTYTFSYESINGMPQVYIYYDKLWGNCVRFFNISYTPNYTHNVDSGIYIIGYFGAITSGTEYSIVKPMLRPAEVTDATYEPYKETVTYIPLNEPLRSSLDGTVTDEVSLTEVNRRFAKVVFDGSESWVLFSTNTFAISVVSAKGNGNAVCSHYKYSTDGANNTFYIRPSGTITFVDTTCATLAEWKAKLQANPMRIIYELAEPIIEAIEPVDIVTYDNVTYLTASDNAEMEVTYATDTKTYIDNKFAELQAAILATGANV